jgi:peptidyl-prolyl cis-trans isomerase D
MSIIQKIRDKGSWIMVTLLVLALISFIFMDARTNLFGGDENPTIGSVNGKKIKRNAFIERLNALRAAYKGNEQATEAALSSATWDLFVQENSMKSELSPLVEDLTDEQLEDVAIGKNGMPSQYITQLISTYAKEYNQQATDDQGRLNPVLAESYIRDGKTGRDPNKKEFYAHFKALLPVVKFELAQQRLQSTLQSSAFIPTWVADKAIADSKNMTSISYIEVPYSDVNDSTVKEVAVTDAEIKSYIAKYPNKFKVEDSRDMDYVVFDYNPTAADSLFIKNKVDSSLVKLVNANDSNVKTIMASSGSIFGYNDSYFKKNQHFIDSNKSYTIGQMISPFVKDGNYIGAKVMDIKSYADSAMASHILVAAGGENGKSLEDAKKLMDSIVSMYRAGVSFDSLARKYSEDPGSKDKGGFGVYAYGTTVPEFNKFIYEKPVGDTGVVKTQFGYHFIKNNGFKGASNQYYKVAYIARKIGPSEQTVNNTQAQASSFSAANRNAKAFDEYLTKNPNVIKRNGYNITRNRQQIMGLNGETSELVRWVYGAKVGEVSDVINIKESNYYIVGKLVKIQNEGVRSVEDIRKDPMLISTIANSKKYDYLAKKYKSPTTLEEAATLTGKTIFTKDSVSFASGIPGLPTETKIVGYAFSKDGSAKVSGPIKGNNALYYAKANVAPFQNANSTMDVKTMTTQLEQSFNQELRIGMDTYRKLATIKDKRIENKL